MIDIAKQVEKIIQQEVNAQPFLLPATVESYNEANKSVRVKFDFLLQDTKTNTFMDFNELTPEFQLWRFGGGAFEIDYEMKAGDKVLIVFFNKDFQRWIFEGVKVQESRRSKMVDYANGYALPFKVRNQPVNSNNVIKIKEGSIEIKAGGHSVFQILQDIINLTADIATKLTQATTMVDGVPVFLENASEFAVIASSITQELQKLNQITK